MKRFISITLAFVLALSTACTAFAADVEPLTNLLDSTIVSSYLENNTDVVDDSSDENLNTEIQQANLLIDQVYGGGGKGDTPISNSFIELYNPDGKDVDLSGYTLVYGDKTLKLSGSIPANSSYLVVGAAEVTSDEFLAYDLPDADKNCDWVIDNKSYTVNLIKGDEQIDSVTAGNSYATKISKQKSLKRNDHSEFQLVLWKKTDVTVDEAYINANAPRNIKGEYGSVHTGIIKPVYTPVVTGDSRADWAGLDNEYENKTSPTGNVTLDSKVVWFNANMWDGLDDSKAYVFGGRSFSIYEVTDSGLSLVYDSGSEFEEITSDKIPEYFNTSNDKNSLDNRSGKKGPEPESVVTGTVEGKTYAFIALERIGGVMAYDITKPEHTSFVNYINYINSREFDTAIQGDVSPEGLCFVPASDSKTGKPLLLAACEVSGTLAVYACNDNPPVEPTDPTPEKVNGDVDCDGVLKVNDATAIQYWIAKLSYDDELDLSVADFDGNGKINIVDVTLIQLVLAELA